MWGIFGKPLKRAIRNTLGLHAVLTVCLIFLSFLDAACVACCLFLSTGSHHVCIQIHATCCCVPRCTIKAIGSEKSACFSIPMGAALNFEDFAFCNRYDKLVQWRWFHHITWCVLIKRHSYKLCDAASRAMDHVLHNVDYYYGLTDMAGLTIQHVVRNKQRFVRKLRILKRNDFCAASTLQLHLLKNVIIYPPPPPIHF